MVSGVTSLAARWIVKNSCCNRLPFAAPHSRRLQQVTSVYLQWLTMQKWQKETIDKRLSRKAYCCANHQQAPGPTKTMQEI